MPGVVRLGDLCDGHAGQCEPRSAVSGSDTVFANGRAIICVGDPWEFHCAPPEPEPEANTEIEEPGAPTRHDGIQLTGSSTVFHAGNAVARIGDMISCGAINAEGSNNVFIGG